MTSSKNWHYADGVSKAAGAAAVIIATVYFGTNLSEPWMGPVGLILSVVAALWFWVTRDE